MSRRFVTVVSFSGVVIGAAAAYLLTTVLMDALPDTALVAGAAIIAAVATALVTRPSLRRMRRAPRAAVARAAVGGLACWWAAPLLVLAQRATDAPSGAETLFFTTSVFGVACVVFGYVWHSGPRPSFIVPASAAVALAGAAGLLASWERPSSFSPFARFPVQEVWMCAAAVVFALGAVSLASATRRLGACDAGSVGLLCAALVGALASLPSIPVLAAVPSSAWSGVLYLGLATALLSASWIRVGERHGIEVAGAALLLGPVALTVMAGVERLGTVYGASPVDWPAALASIGVIGLAVFVLWQAQAETRSVLAMPTPRVLGSLVGALVIVAFGSLFSPALTVSVSAHAAEPFSAIWVQPGYLSAAGWMVFAAAVMGSSAALAWRAGWSRRSCVSGAALGLACCAAAVPLGATTLQTQNRWIPAAVQQAYGTEYAQLTATWVVDPLRGAVAAASVALCIFVAVQAWAPESRDPEDKR